MCLSCNCGKPNDDHGDPRHITLEKMQEAARAGNISLDQACDNIMKSYRQAQQGGQLRN